MKCKPDSWNSPEGFRTRSALWAKVDPLSKDANGGRHDKKPQLQQHDDIPFLQNQRFPYYYPLCFFFHVYNSFDHRCQSMFDLLNLFY